MWTLSLVEKQKQEQTIYDQHTKSLERRKSCVHCPLQLQEAVETEACITLYRILSIEFSIIQWQNVDIPTQWGPTHARIYLS